MKGSKEFLIIRYIALISIATQCVVLGSAKEIVSIIFALSIIVNNHLRVFLIKGGVPMYISIIGEVLISSIAYFFYGGNIVVYYIPVIMDIFISIKNVYLSHILKGVIFILGIVISSGFKLREAMTSICLLCSVYMFMSYIVESDKKKKDAQILYDKLRISEEELKKANTNLEVYSKSVEDLAVLKERNRISREIHDSVGHALSTTIIQLTAIELMSKKENKNISEMVKGLREFVNESFQDVRKAVKELKPSDYDVYEGILRIEELIKNFNKLTGIEVKYSISNYKWPLNSKQITNLYRIVQETLSNSARHGKASKIEVFMNFNESELVLTIRDNGIGCKELKKSGVGIKSIEERVEELRGTVEITTAVGTGFSTKIIISRERDIEQE